jgi:hypothetical protein
LKTLEAFELGLPTVATTLAVRGIGMLPANCTVADDPAAFAAALVEASRHARDADGRAFHQGRRAAQLAALAQGVAALERAAAPAATRGRAS